MKTEAHSVDLREGEHVVRQVRRHMFVFFLNVTAIIVVAFIGTISTPPAAIALSQLGVANSPIIVAILYLFLVLILVVVFFFKWTDYYLDVWIITNQRIFNIEQRGAFHRETTAFEIENVQDVNVSVKGIVATFVNYGTVHVHTAGERIDLSIKDVHHPLEVKKVILEQYARISQGKRHQKNP